MSRYNATTGEFDFGIALDALRGGRRVSRRAWGKDEWIALQAPEPGIKINHPYIYVREPGGDKSPWSATQGDLLAGDWVEVL